MSETPSLAMTLRQAAEAAGGWLGFDRFMGQALLHPSEGYYARSHRRRGPFGPEGDFITAPELGPWMGAAMARAFARLQSEAAWPLSILEVGPGTGALAAQILMELADRDCLPEAYWMVEPSAFLRTLQRDRLSQILSGRPDATALLGRCRWASGLDGTAAPIHGLVLAHEVLDALPVQLFEWIGTQEPVMEWGLRWEPEQQGWTWCTRPALPDAMREVRARAAQAEALGGWMQGHRCEIAPGLTAMVQALWAHLASGALVVVDYGYERHELDHPDRHRGTLAAHLAHERLDAPEDWISDPGSRDLTAHVDFTRVAQVLRQHGAGLLHLKSQAAWLLDHGVLEKAEALLFADRSQRGRPPESLEQLHALSQLQTLLSDAAMGQRFMVLSAFKPLAQPG